MQMATFILVHGAWQTAKTWDLVANKLRSFGHIVAIPHLRGLENDSLVLSPEITLQTHVEDVVDFLSASDFEDAILVGHSYAGMIIAAVAERAFDRLKRLIYVDAFVPQDNQSAFDLFPEAFLQRFRETAKSTGDGWRLPASERQLDMWGLKPGWEREFVKSCLSDFTIRCFEERARLPTNAASKLPRSYVACTRAGYPARAVFQRFGYLADAEGWQYHELLTGHDCHVEMPDAFVSLLEQN
jgi:pimeloyl-ACP methyl ester carboxylesterase